LTIELNKQKRQLYKLSCIPMLNAYSVAATFAPLHRARLAVYATLTPTGGVRVACVLQFVFLIYYWNIPAFA